MKKFKILKLFRLLNTSLGGDGLVHHPGDVIEISSERAEELEAKLGEGFIEEIENEYGTQELKDLNLTQLKKLAASNNLEIPNGVTKKSDILALILESEKD